MLITLKSCGGHVFDFLGRHIRRFTGSARNARVVDEHVEAAVAAQDVACCGIHGFIARDIQFDEAPADGIRCDPASPGIASADIDRVSGIHEPARGFEAESLVCASNQSDRHFSIIGDGGTITVGGLITVGGIRQAGRVL